MLLAHGFLARVFEVFGRHHVVVDLVTTSEVSISVTVDDAARLDDAHRRAGGDRPRRGAARPGGGGGGGRGRAARRSGSPATSSRCSAASGIGVEMISQGASRVNLSFVVREEDADRAVRLLHRGLGLDAEVAAATASA